MMNAIVPGLLLAALACPPVSAQRSWEIPRGYPVAYSDLGIPFVADEVLVGLTSNEKRSQLIEEARGLGAELLGEIPRRALIKLSVPAGTDAKTLASHFEKFDFVSYSSLNFIGSGGGTPVNDTHFGEQWHLQNTGQTGGTPGADIDAQAAWEIEQGDPGVVIAILHSGIDLSHPEFAGRLLPGRDFVDEDLDPTAEHPSGIYLAGVLAANGDNGFQTSGVDRECSVLPIRVLDEFNNGTSFDLAQALDFCAEEEVDVVSMGLKNYLPSPVLNDALLGAREAGCILVANAGNNGIGDADLSGPGASPLTISIAHTNDDDYRAFFAATGNALDFVAPGFSLRTISLDGTSDDFGLISGGNAATQVAAGIIGLLKARHPHIDQSCAYELLVAGAADQVGGDPLDTPGYDTFYGHGRIDAAASLAAVTPCVTPAILTGTPDSLDIVAGGVQEFNLQVLDALSGQLYLLLTSAATSPGIPVDGFVLPLAFDSFLSFSLAAANTPTYPNSLGILDESGQASASFVLPSMASFALTGLTLNHAFVVLDLTGGTGVLAVSNTVPLALFQETELLNEGFEDGALDWSFDNGSNGQWHLAPDGECGVSITQMAAYNQGEPACEYAGVSFQGGGLVSPSFRFSDLPPFRISFDSYRELDAAAFSSTELLLAEVGGAQVQKLVQTAEFTDGVLESFQVTVDDPAAWVGKTAELRFSFFAASGGDNVAGWLVDNVRVTVSGP